MNLVLNLTGIFLVLEKSLCVLLPPKMKSLRHLKLRHLSNTEGRGSYNYNVIKQNGYDKLN